MSFGNRYSALGLGVLCAYLSAKGGGKLPFPCSFASHHCKIWHYNPAGEEEGVGSADTPAPVRKNGFLLDSKEPDWSKLPPQGRQPQHGDRRKEMLEDIAILTGGTVISSAVDLPPCGRQPQHKLEDADLSMLGQSEKISIDKDNTTIVSGKGNSDAIKALVGQIKAQIEKTTSDYDRNEQYENLLQSGVFDPAKERESSELSPCGP